MARGGIKPWQLFAALGIVIVFLFLAFTPAGQNLSGLNGAVSNQTTGTKGYVVTKPLQITCVDPLAAANCGAVTIALYQGSTNTQLESAAATSSGVFTSTNSYTSGTSLTAKVSGNSKATEYIPFVVPTGYVTDTNEVFTIYAVTLGSWTQVLTGTNGATTFVSGSQYALSTYSGTTLQITDTVTESTNNAGYKSSYDITNLVNQYWVVQVDDGGGASSNSQYLLLQGLPSPGGRANGNTNFYFNNCPDGLSGSFIGANPKVVVGSQSFGTTSSTCTGAASLQTIGTQSFGGSVSFSFTVSLGSLAAGNVETLSFKVYYYADPAYYAANGNLGPNAAQAGSTFTIKFNK